MKAPEIILVDQINGSEVNKIQSQVCIDAAFQNH